MQLQHGVSRIQRRPLFGTQCRPVGGPAGFEPHRHRTAPCTYTCCRACPETIASEPRPKAQVRFGPPPNRRFMPAGGWRAGRLWKLAGADDLCSVYTRFYTLLAATRQLGDLTGAVDLYSMRAAGSCLCWGEGALLEGGCHFFQPLLSLLLLCVPPHAV